MLAVGGNKYYKYVTLSRLDDLLGLPLTDLRAGRQRLEYLDWNALQGHVRFTQLPQLNDPFEIPSSMQNWLEKRQPNYWPLLFPPILAYRLYRTTYRRLLRRKKQLPNSDEVSPQQTTAQYKATAATTHFNKAFGILSLATRLDSLLMWAHYADEHKGAVVELDIDDATFNAKIKNTIEYPMYSIGLDFDLDNIDMDRPPRGLQIRGLVRYTTERAQVEVFETEERFHALNVAQHCFQKSPDWAYEKEFRIIRVLKDGKCTEDKENADEPLARAAATDILVSPHVPNNDISQGKADPEAVRNYPVCLFPLPSSAIRNIYLGARFDNAEYEKVLLRCIRHPKSRFGHVGIYRARPDAQAFALEFKKIWGKTGAV